MGTQPDYDALARTLRRHKNLLLEGVPGTGKTYAIQKVIDAIRAGGKGVGGDGTGDFAVTMHPSTSYEDFVEGLKPASTSTDCAANNAEIWHRQSFQHLDEKHEISYTLSRSGQLTRIELEGFELSENILNTYEIQVYTMGATSTNETDARRGANKKIVSSSSVVLPQWTNPSGRVKTRGKLAYFLYDADFTFSGLPHINGVWSISEDIVANINHNAQSSVIQYTMDDQHIIDRTPHPDPLGRETGVRWGFLFSYKPLRNSRNKISVSLEPIDRTEVALDSMIDQIGASGLSELDANRQGNASVEMNTWYLGNNRQDCRVFVRVKRHQQSNSSFIATREREGDGRDVIIFGLGHDCCIVEEHLARHPDDVVSYVDLSFAHFSTLECHGMNGAQQLNLTMEEGEDQGEEDVGTAEIDDNADGFVEAPETHGSESTEVDPEWNADDQSSENVEESADSVHPAETASEDHEIDTVEHVGGDQS